MLQKIKAVYNSARSLSQFYLRTHNKVASKKQSPTAILNADTSFLIDDLGRYTNVLSQLLVQAGYQVVIKADRTYFQKQKRYNKLMDGKGYRFIRKFKGPANTLLLLSANGRAQAIYLGQRSDLQPNKVEQCGAPYPMHPFVYDFYPTEKKLAAMRQAQRTISIFFAGNIDANLYDKGKVEERYQLIPRNTLLGMVRNLYQASGMLYQVTERNKLDQLLEGQMGKAPIVLSAAKSESSEWLDVLSKADFFLCPPGVGMPWCHNLTEAMAVGAIPILQYHQYVTPELKDGLNCLAFSNEAEFKEVMEKARNMSETEISRMRSQVIRYYDNYLSPQAVVKKIQAFAASGKDAVVLSLPFMQYKENS